jgi:hypothetical protein
MIGEPSQVIGRPLFRMQLSIGTIMTIGGPPGNQTRLATIAGGTFEGDRLKGVVRAGGTDWQRVRADGSVLVDARIVLETHTGALIAMSYMGIRTGPPDVMASLDRGDVVDPQLYYFRIMPTFSTADTALDWLNHIIGIGVGDRLPEGPTYAVHEIL